MKKQHKSAPQQKLTTTKENLTIKTPLVLLIVGLTAITARLVYFLELQRNSPVYQRLVHDSALFNELAHNILDNGLLLDTPFYISPLYIYFLAIIYAIFGDSINTVRIVQFLMGTGTALLTFGITLKFYNKKTALIAGLLTAVYAPFLFFEANLLGTSVATFSLVLSFYLMLLQKDKLLGWLPAFCSGLFLALAVTGRPNLLLLVPIPILYYILNNHRKIGQAGILAGSALIGMLIPLLLTGIHNKKAGGEFTILTTHGGINFYIGNHDKASGAWQAPEGIEASVSAINLEQSKKYAEEELGRELSSAEVSQFWYKKGLLWGIQHPVQWIILLGKKFVMFWSGYETPLNFDYNFHQKYSTYLKLPFLNFMFYVSFSILGMIVLIRKWKEYWPLYATILLVCLSIVMFFMSDRYRVVVVPFMIIFAAGGLVELAAIFNGNSVKRWIYGGGLIVLLTIQVAYTQGKSKNANFANDYYNLALAHLIDEDYKTSIYWGQRAAIANPLNFNTHFNLGVANLKLQRYDTAYKSFSTALEINPNSAGANRSIGAILLMRQQYYQAKRYLEKSFAVEPDNPQCLMNLGLAYYYMGEPEKAIEKWKLLEKIDPKNQQVINNIRAAENELNR